MTIGAAELVRRVTRRQRTRPRPAGRTGRHVARGRSRWTPQLAPALTNLFDNADIHGGGADQVPRRARGPSSSTSTSRTPARASPTENRERVFERFARAGSHKEGTGSGLGLSIVAQTLRNHGGSVWCSESPDGGAALTLRLPMSTAAGS